MPHHRWSRIVQPIRLLLVAMLVTTTGISGNALAAQDDAAPSFPLDVVGGNGVEIVLLALETAMIDPASGNHLTLERITVQPDAVFASHAPEAPALIVGESGSILAEDERGFLSRIDAPFQLMMEAGSASSWTATEPASFLRLSMTEKPPAPSTAEGVEVEVLASLVAGQVSAESSQLFIARATLAPGMASVRLDQSGTTGLQVEAGTIEVLSPSGLEGQLETGASILFPQSAPMNLLGTNGTDATALLFGITDTPETTTIFQSSVVDYCRNTTESCTPTGSVLANGDTWELPHASLTLNGTTGGSASWKSGMTMTLDLTYTNRGDETVEFNIDPGAIAITDEGGGTWAPQTEAGHTFALQPGDNDTMTIDFAPPEGAGEGNVTISVPEFGAISGAQWQGHVELLIITPPESTLAFGETWMSETANLTIAVRQATAEETSQPNRDIALEITYTNVSDESSGMAIAPTDFVVRYPNGGNWARHTSNSATTIRVEPGESRSIIFLYRGQPGRYGGDVIITVRDLGGIQGATWEGPNPITE